LPFAKSLNLLAQWQTEKGQIPNCVGSYNTDRRSTKTYNTMDSSLWYIIGHYVYFLAYEHDGLFRAHKHSIARALVWLRYQDPNEDRMLTQLPTMDWQDCFPHKYGHVLNTQALYYAVLRLVGDEKEALHLRRNMNGEVEHYLDMYDPKLGYYLPWNWKNHDGDREQEEWFDSLGNLLAIISGLATKEIATNILEHINKDKIERPFPVKTIYPPIYPGDKEWHSYFSKSDARTPYHYLNAGIWPFIGGFYVAALVKMKRHKEAQAALKKLAEANMQTLNGHEFNEWLDGQTGEPKGEPYQAWSAGTYIYAYECVTEKKAIYFE
jgi:glycogen debranching enzyme